MSLTQDNPGANFEDEEVGDDEPCVSINYASQADADVELAQAAAYRELEDEIDDFYPALRRPGEDVYDVTRRVLERWRVCRLVGFTLAASTCLAFLCYVCSRWAW